MQAGPWLICDLLVKRRYVALRAKPRKQAQRDGSVDYPLTQVITAERRNGSRIIVLARRLYTHRP
jgi:hypothetical protein